MSIQNRFYEKRLKRIKLKLLIYGSLSIVFISSLFYFLFLSSYFDIQGYSVIGTDIVPRGDVRSTVIGVAEDDILFSLLKRQNIFLFSSRQAERKVREMHPIIKEVRVKKNFPERNITIQTQERQPLGIACGKYSVTDGCFNFDETGTIFTSSPLIVGATVLRIQDDSLGGGMTLPVKKYEEHEIDFISSIKRHILDTSAIAIESFFFLNRYGDVEAKTINGFTILLNMEQDPEIQAKILRNLLDLEIKDQVAELDYIDLRVDSRAYYKFKE